jgi:hypothetical protein
MKKGQNKKLTFTILIVASFFVLIMFFVAPNIFSVTYENIDETNNENISTNKENISNLKTEEEQQKNKISYVDTPDAVKTIYMSACVASTFTFKQDLVDLIEETELNSIIIDIKDFSGGISFDTENPVLKPYVSKRCGASDMAGLVRTLNEKGVYVIGRITVFQDPLYADAHPEIAVQKASDRSTWSDNKGIHFIDVGAEKYWEYIVELSKESHRMGFDELNFDYVRYPSDGPMKDIYFPIRLDWLL